MDINKEITSEITLETTFIDNDDVNVKSKKVIRKNLIVVGVMNLLIYSALIPINSLISTVAGKTLGSITFGLNYFFTCSFSFISVSVMNNETSKKKAILLGGVCLVSFTFCNWYISYYTLIPGTVLFGVGLATTWISSLLYISKIAAYHARNNNINEQNTASYFVGIILAFAMFGYIVGNATTAGVLTILKSNDSSSGNNNDSSKECHTNDDMLEINFTAASVLKGLVVCYSLSGLLVAVFFLDDIDKDQNTHCESELLLATIKQMKKSAIAVTQIAIRKEMLLSCPLFFTSGICIGFIFSNYTKVFVSECVGVHIVGYAIMMYGLGSALGSFVTGKLLALEMKVMLVLGALTLHLTVMLFLVIWEREPILLLLLFVTALWGICDGTWVTSCSSFVATSFGEDSRHSFALYRVLYLLGVCCSGLFALLIPVKATLIILCVLLSLFAPLHLIITSRRCTHMAATV